MKGDRQMDGLTFLTIAVLAFSLVMILAGLFTAYFGTGKSRKVGLILFVVGLIVGLVWAYLGGFSDIAPFNTLALVDIVLEAAVNFIGIILGTLVAVGIFLYAVMKS